MSKLLYLFLRDAYGKYKNIERNRNVDIDKLRHMMNTHNEKTTNSNFITELKKSVDTINRYSDLTVKYTVDKKRNLRSGVSEIIRVKFTIKWDEKKLFEIRLKDRNEKKKSKEELKNKDIDKSDEDTTDIATVTEYLFKDYLEDCIEEEYQRQLSYGKVIKNEKSYRKGIEKNLIEDGIEIEFEFVSMIEKEKDGLKGSIADKQPYMIIFKDDSNLYDNYYINDECLWVKRYDGSIVTNSIEESLEFIEKNRMNFFFDIDRCSESYINVGRI